jgi:hypothetical protein
MPRGWHGPRPAGWINPRKGKPRPGAMGPLERFWKRVGHHHLGECWNWPGPFNSAGYGDMHLSGDPKIGTRKRMLAHRFSWELHNAREVPEGLMIDHTCMNIRCVNPAHLRAVTPKVSATENSAAPVAQNAAKTHCGKCGNPFSGANLAIYYYKRWKTRHGVEKTGKKAARVCLTCQPNYWRWAVIPRSPPPGSHKRGISSLSGRAEP